MGKPGAAVGDLLFLIAQNFDVLAGPLVSLGYPLYASIRAIETRNVTDDQQWLTYWVLYSMITLFELTFYSLVEWIPFWSYAKLIITCWLVIPPFSSATYVYQHYVRPFYTGNQTINVWYVPKKKDVVTPLTPQDDILVSANKYIHETGPDTFQETMPHSAVDSEVMYRGNTFDADNGVDYRGNTFGADNGVNYRGNTFDADNGVNYRGNTFDVDNEVKYRGNTFFTEDDYVY